MNPNDDTPVLSQLPGLTAKAFDNAILKHLKIYAEITRSEMIKRIQEIDSEFEPMGISNNMLKQVYGNKFEDYVEFEVVDD